MKSPFVDFVEVEQEKLDNNFMGYVDNFSFEKDLELEDPFMKLSEDFDTYSNEDVYSEYEDHENFGEFEDENNFSAQAEEEDFVEENEYEQFEDELDKDLMPISVPKNNPIPFARLAKPNSYWPFKSNHSRAKEIAYQLASGKEIGNSSRRFLTSRSGGKRYHVAIDLYANYKDPIIACEDGVITNFYPFYHGVWALFVEHGDLVINYGEVDKDSLKIAKLKIGDSVKAGQQIGIVGKMHTSSMLHFETYVKGTKSNQRFMVGQTRPKQLLNPTLYLLSLKDNSIGNNNFSLPSINPPSSNNTLNIKKAIELNRKYSNQLGWAQFYDKINDFLLPFSGLSNVSLGEDAFASAVAAWQQSIGNRGNDVDGIIGPKTWEILKEKIKIVASESNVYKKLKEIENGAIPVLGGIKVPYGFKLTHYSNYEGLVTTSALKVENTEKVILDLFQKGKLTISQEELDLIQRVSNVETSGKIQLLNSYDRGIVSIGFMQFTIHVGKIQEWIALNENSFRKFGIELDRINKYKLGDESVIGIKGVSQANLNDLRFNGWAERFYYAGLNEDIIVAEVTLAKNYFAKHLRGLKYRLKDDRRFEFFITNFYNKDAYIKGLFQASYNNNPARATKAIHESTNNVASVSIEQFKNNYISTLKLLGWERLVKETAKGTSLNINFLKNEYENESYENYDYENQQNLYAENEDEYQMEDEFDSSELEMLDEFNVDSNLGISEYLNVSAVKNRNLKTGVFIPSQFAQGRSIDLIIYLHGLYNQGDSKNGIAHYWKNYSNIREYFSAGNRNAILIAPTLGSNPQTSDLIFRYKNGLDQFVNQCLKELIDKQKLSLGTLPGKIIIAAHSAGGFPMSMIFRNENSLKSNIMEAWGFDCFYNYQWEKVLSNNPNITFYHYWAFTSNGTHSQPGMRGNELAKRFNNLKNVKPLEKISHRNVIENAWKTEINTRQWFTPLNNNFSNPQDESYFDNFENDQENEYENNNFGEINNEKIKVYLTLKGQKQGQIKGSVIQRGKENSIAIHQLHHEVFVKRDISGMPLGGRTYKPLIISKEVDKSSVNLMNSFIQNENLSQIVINFWRTFQNKEVNFYRIIIPNANISNISQVFETNNSKTRLVEKIEFNFMKIEFNWIIDNISAEDREFENESETNVWN